MRRGDYIPTRESVFHPWAKNLVSVSSGNYSRWQIPNTDVSNLSTSFTTYDAKYQTALNPATRTKPAVQAKNDAKKTFTGVLRKFTRRYLLYNPLVTNDDRDLLRLPIPDLTPTPVPPPKTWPNGTVDTSVHQRHTVHVTDSVEVHPHGGLPSDAHGFETWCKVGGTMPASDEEFTYVNFSTTSSLTVNYPLDKVGQTVWYRFRWVNERNQPGPWSETVSAVIP
jgi:hypothetical protein